MRNSSRFKLLDTFPRFLEFWKVVRDIPVDRQIEYWATSYLGPYHELLAKQARDYASQGIEWRRIATERIFPFIPERLPRMRAAHRSILAVAKPAWMQAQKTLGLPLSLQVVIHVGIGCGAGWATVYGGRPAILLGLENIAEERWSDRESIRALLTHEIGHLFLLQIRRKHHRPIGRGAYWQLFDEGFACLIEQAISSGRSPSRRSSAYHREQLSKSEMGSLASQFLQAATRRRPVNPFFGSWLEVNDRSEVGYVLGFQIISSLVQESSLLHVALTPHVNNIMRKELQRYAILGA